MDSSLFSHPTLRILVLALIALVAIGVAAFQLLFGSQLVSRLIGKYLFKRRIAWVSLVAVMLCTTMVVVVRSVMGGWLNMFKESFHGLTGDIVVEGGSLSGFPYYQEIIGRLEQLPEVEAAVPTIYSFGLINIGNRKSDGVQVLGYPIERMAQVNQFRSSLHRQHQKLLDEAADPATPRVRAELLRKMAALPPTMDLRTYVRVPLEKLPEGVELKPDGETFTYNPASKLVIFRGVMSAAERDLWIGKTTDPVFQEAVRILYDKSTTEVVDYTALVPKARTDPNKWPGLIAGVGVVSIRKDKEGKEVGRYPELFEFPTKLTVMGMNPDSSSMDMAEKAELSFWIVDDSRTGVWQFDSKTVYIPFEVLQRMLGMGQKEGVDKETGAKVIEPARATDVQVKVKDGVDLQVAKAKIKTAVEEVFASHPDAVKWRERVGVETWEEDKATFINAIENETVLMTFLFGIISVVAVFLIFCIFYMIVVEKTKDIGIIKSVGATAGGVAGIFLGYGLLIGLVGAGLGLLMSYLIVTNINAIHTKLGEWMGVQIWNPEVYLFDKIPNTLNPMEVTVIMFVMIIACVLGALIPAIIAAMKKPVDALRWE